MRNIVPKDSRYIPLTQQKSCCVPTSISIIMYKLKIPLIPQELLGYHLGLILDKKYKYLFCNVRTGKRPKAGYGTQTNKKQYEINSIFKKLKIPLNVTTYRINDFKNKNELISYIAGRIKKDKDIMVLLRSGILNNDDTMNGHACVIDQIYPKKNIIRLIDPLSDQAKWREFKIDKFIKAVKSHPTGDGRFLEFRKI